MTISASELCHTKKMALIWLSDTLLSYNSFLDSQLFLCVSAMGRLGHSEGVAASRALPCCEQSTSRALTNPQRFLSIYFVFCCFYLTLIFYHGLLSFNMVAVSGAFSDRILLFL